MASKPTLPNHDGAPCVLIVDDNHQNLELLQVYLEELDCQTIAAFNGKEAIHLVNEQRPDIVLLDIMMPQMSGFEVCKRIKEDDNTKDIPVIMVTALNEYGDIERGIDSGADDFISKPVNRLELITRVRTMLKIKHLSDKLERTLAYISSLEESSNISK